MIEKRKVTMRKTHGPLTFEQTDFVPVEILDAYVADARKRWTTVTVGDVHDPGPGGDDGPTFYPPHLIGA